MMKKTLVFALALMLVAMFAVGCSTDGNDTVTVSPTAAPTVETDDGNVTDDATTDKANDAASNNIMDDMSEAIEGDATVEPAAEATEAAAETTGEN